MEMIEAIVQAPVAFARSAGVPAADRRRHQEHLRHVGLAASKMYAP